MKSKAQKGIWEILETKTLAITNFGCRVIGEVIEVQNGGRVILTTDGIRITEIEIVVFSTGNSISFKRAGQKEEFSKRDNL